MRDYPEIIQRYYPSASDKIEIKRELLFDYQLKIDDLSNILIGNVKKLVPNFFEKEKYVIHYENLQLYLRLGLNKKKIHPVLESNQSSGLNNMLNSLHKKE